MTENGKVVQEGTLRKIDIDPRERICQEVEGVFGGVMELEVRRCRLSVRTSEANQVFVVAA